ncbi:MAG: RsmB/NOP family class I SAM-dependent RNA methyltransferase [Hyphomicrobiaceae bacterium]|nr:MAG: RsmB/NOP family class I SAM-dependent RNA methyltransferase [Hyphomicrobiaceae bacterium]
MRPGARIKAAIEVLEEVVGRHRPAAAALADWGKSHRFAGSGDRTAIGNLVYDALRRRRSLAAQMGADTPRAIALAAASRALGLPPSGIIASADGTVHAVEALSAAEQAGLTRELPADTPVAVRGDFPDWLTPSFERVFGSAAAEEGAALARRAPVDLRVNALKADREKVLKALARFAPMPTPLSPLGVRLAAPEGPSRTPNVEAEGGHGKGWYEVQDEASQIAALMAGAAPRAQVLDICAGAGGKTLALAGAMRNTGQIYAYDEDAARLRPIFERLKRAGVRNAQVLAAGDKAALAALGPRFDLVFVDAPCTGTGVWRRRPDAKWRLKPANLAQRQEEQRAVLESAAALVKPGGRVVYVTCSVLAEENGDQVRWFVANHAGFVTLPWRQAWTAGVGGTPPASADDGEDALLLTPGRHGTDGFFIAVLSRQG